MAPSTSPQSSVAVTTTNGANMSGKGEDAKQRISSRVVIMPGLVNNQDLLDLLSKVRRKCDLYGFFSRPVDPVRDACPDYFDIISEADAMDLRTLEDLIRQGKVCRVKEFEVCIARMIQNARAYNEDELNFVRIQTEKFALEFDVIMKEFRNESQSSESIDHESASTVLSASESRVSHSSETKIIIEPQQSSSSNSNTSSQRKSSRMSPKKRRFADVEYHVTPNSDEKEGNAFITRAFDIAKRQGASLNQIQISLIDLLRCIRRTCDPNSLFTEPVDPVEDDCDDYYDVIPRQQAMDLGTMESMIKDGRIMSIEKFEECVQRIIDNSRTYNEDEENFVRIETEKFCSLVKPLLEMHKSKLKLHRKRLFQDQKRSTRYDSDDNESVDSEYSSGGRSRSLSVSDYEISMRKSSKRIFVRAKAEKSKIRNKSQRNSSSGKVHYVDADNDSDSFSSPWSRRYPCRAQGQDNDHNSKTAHFVVTNETEHGSFLECSYPKCREKGIKFLFCLHCDVPVSKSNFERLHKHSKSLEHCQCQTDDGVSSRHQYVYTPRDAAIPGASIPPTRKDLSSSHVIPVTERKKWVELVPEMLVVCNEAARRAKLVENPLATRYDKPLSETYIEERLEYDNPLRGYVVRSKDRNDLQGFVMACNFMVFRETFRWDSSAPQAGITPADRREHKVDDSSISTCLADSDIIGNVDDGLIYGRVAEISLLGGLGCGGALLEKVLDDLNQSSDYDFVVLQATKMAISFYEKHGFVRVGAVARFEDNPDCPEVSYRHWGDIVRGRAVEASYMMAQRLPNAKTSKVSYCLSSTSEQLKSLPNKNDTPRTAQKKFTALREAEAIESLSIARSLAKGAIELVTDTTVGQSSYIELLSLSRDATKSARGQSKLTKEIQRALQSFKKEGCDTVSKSILHTAFKFDEKCIRTFVNVNKERISDTAVVAWVPIQKYHRSVPTELGLQFDDELIERDFSVSVKVHSQIFPDSIRATVCSPHLSIDNRQSKEAIATVFYMFCKVAFGKDKVTIGDTIMVPSRTDSGVPTWRVAEVDRKCSSSDRIILPNGYQLKNSYVCSVDNGETIIVEMNSSITSRGVGRKWCTIGDWASFSSLPIELLDSMLIGSLVEYVNHDGSIVNGSIHERVGGGLGSEPKWRVVASGKGRKVKGKLFSASELRDYLQITEKLMERSYSMITSSLDEMPAMPRIGIRGYNRCKEEQPVSEPTWIIPRLSVSDACNSELIGKKLKIRENGNFKCVDTKEYLGELHNRSKKQMEPNKYTYDSDQGQDDVTISDEGLYHFDALQSKSQLRLENKNGKRHAKNRRRVLRKRDNCLTDRLVSSKAESVTAQLNKRNPSHLKSTKRRMTDPDLQSIEVELPRTKRSKRRR